MYTLSWTQAIEMMKQGKRVKNQYFTSEEFFEIKGTQIVDEAGYSMERWYRGEAWQEEGWMVIDSDEDKIICELRNIVAEKEITISHFGSMHYYAVNYTVKEPKQEPIPKDYASQKIYKGRGHNKLQKKGKK